MTNIQPALGSFLQTCGNHYSSCADKTVSLQTRTCSRVHVAVWYWLVLTVCRAYWHWWVRESTASSMSTDDKTASIQYELVTSLAANNNALAHSHGYNKISCTIHALSNIHGLYGCSCNLLDVTSVYSLNPGKLPGRFSYKWPTRLHCCWYKCFWGNSVQSATEKWINHCRKKI